MAANAFKCRLNDRTPQPGLWISMCSPVVAEIASRSGADWLLIDMEHAPNEVASVLDQLRAAQGGCPVIVRPPQSEPVITKRLLDIGVQSLMFPMIQSAEQAREAVSWTRYPPRGMRGISGVIRANGYGTDTDYLQDHEVELCVIAQVETPEAVARIPEIAEVDGIDAIFIGPGDLAASMGHAGNGSAPDVQAMIRNALGKIHDAGLPAGILGYGEATARLLFEIGADFVAVGADTWLMVRHTRELVENSRPVGGSQED